MNSKDAGPCPANLRAEGRIEPAISHRAPESAPRFSHFIADSVKLLFDLGHVEVLVRDVARADQLKVALGQPCGQPDFRTWRAFSTIFALKPELS